MSNRFRRIKRLGAALTAGALGVGFLPIAALTTTASAATAPPGAIDTSAFCANVPATNPFTDLPDTDVHFDNVLCIAYAGITVGKTATTYDPSTDVRRDQMASFIARMIDKANALEDPAGPDAPLTDLPATGPDVFSDVNGDVHKTNINRLADAGIVLGLNDQQCADLGVPAPCYGPAEGVTRAQMASFINRAIGFLTGTPLSTTTDFFDDDNGNVHEDNINALASVGIVQGQTGGNYNPDGFVPRDQMGSFIARALAYLNSIGDINVLPAVTPPNNQDFPIDPQLPAVNIASSSASDNTGRHHYDVTIPDPTAVPAVDLIVIPASAVNVDASGFPNINVFFEDDNHDGKADFVDDTNPAFNTTARIEAVNNVNPVGGATPYINNQSTSGGTISVDIDSQFPADGVFLLVFQDTNNDNRLSVDANNQATEPFGLSGFKGWTSCESIFESDFHTDNVIIGGGPLAAVIDFFSATTGHPQVTDPNCATLAGNFGGLGTRYNYDDNDIFRINGVQVSKATFEHALSRGDDVDVSYNPDPAGISEFDIFSNEGFTAPGDLNAVTTNLDSGATGNDVVLTFTTPTFNQAGASYVVQRRSTAGPDAICGTADDTDGALTGFTDVTTLMLDSLHGEDSGDALQYADLNVPDGCYEYRVSVTDPDTTNTEFSNTVHADVPTPPDTTKPSLLQAVLDDNGNPNQLDSSDVVDLIWNEETTPATGDIIQITDQDGEFTNVVLGSGNTFTVLTRGGAAELGQTELHIVFTANPAVAGDLDGNVANNDGILDRTFAPNVYFIDGATGITDVAGNAWEPAGDVISSDTAGPNIKSDDSLAGATSFNVWFNEPVDPASAADPANYKVDNNGFGTSGGTNPVLGVTVSNSSAIQDGAPFNNGWTKVNIQTQLPVTATTVISQTVKDKVGNPGDDTAAAPYGPINAGSLIVMTAGTHVTTEGGGTDTLSVKLAQQATQVVLVGIGSSDTTEGTAQVDLPVSYAAGSQCATFPNPDPSTIFCFDATNWNVFQTATVTGVDDPIDDGNVGYGIGAQASSSDPTFDGQTAFEGFLNIDDDTAGFAITGAPTQVTELPGPNHTDTFSVALTAQPSTTVNVSVVSGDTSDYTVSPGTLTFTPANFATPQTVTVTAVDDNACEADPEIQDTVLTALAGSAEYAGKTANVQNQTSGPEDVCGSPHITQAVINTGANTINLTYNEAVTCDGGDVTTAAAFAYTNTAGGAAGPNRTGTNIVQNGPTGCTVTFDGPAFTTEDAGTVGYTQQGGGHDVQDVDPVPALASSETVQASIAGGPAVSGTPTVSAASDTVSILFNQPVECTSIDSSVPITDDFTVTVNGQAVAITAISGCGAPRDNDLTLTLNRDILAGDIVNITVNAGQLTDNRGDTNSAQTFNGIVAA